MTTRREFLKQFGAASLVSLGAMPPSFLARAAAATEAKPDERILVLVQLAGGNDGLNTVVPFGRDEYYKARPGVGIGMDAVLKLNGELGLHPAMDGFQKLFDEGWLSVIQGVGYPNPDRSHFRSMDIWQSAKPEKDDVSNGWLGRALDSTVEQHVGKVPGLAFGTDKLPLSLVASKINVPTVRDVKGYQLQLGPGNESALKAHKQSLERIASRDAMAGSDLDFLRRTARMAWSSAEQLKQISASYKPATAYPGNALGQKLRTVAEIISSDLSTRMYFVHLDGFDTHSQQANAHQALLTELSSAITAFVGDLKGHGLADRVLVATFSEFGRRVAENGSLGTDHGAASQMFVISPKCKGGIVGAHPSLTDLDDGDLKFHTDFRSVYATLLDHWLSIPSAPVLGGAFRPVEFV
ncbi:MAG: DUF1501 domain-containing protein [Planctomycetes bacterium]|nr:DUF1501 domain-containing protein [Planctomycetota bacterium]